MKKELLENWLRTRIADEIGLRPGQVDVKAPLINYLMGGFQSWRVIPDLENILHLRLPDSVLYERSTIADLAEYLSAVSTRRQQPEALLPILAEANLSVQKNLTV